MDKKIEFIAVHEYGWEIAEKPYPAKNNIPKWWKDMPPYIVDFENPEGKNFLLRNLRNNLSPKKCMPMLDAITSGYIIPLWADIFIKSYEDVDNPGYRPTISWKTTKEVFESEIDGSNHLEGPEGYSNLYKFVNLWCVRTPPGYSIRISSPVGHDDVPFKVVEAIVDTDKYDAALPIPMWLKDGFEGIVECGTPIIQITPFKRESWNSSFDYYPDGKHPMKQEKWLRINSFGNYIKTQWSKKSYK